MPAKERGLRRPGTAGAIVSNCNQALRRLTRRWKQSQARSGCVKETLVPGRATSKRGAAAGSLVGAGTSGPRCDGAVRFSRRDLEYAQRQSRRGAFSLRRGDPKRGPDRKRVPLFK